MMIKRNIFPLPVTVLLVILSSCEFCSDYSSLTVSLPDLPGEYGLPPHSWKIWVLHEDLSCDIFSLHGAARSFPVIKKKEEILCLLAEAVLTPRFSLKPAGLYHDGTGDNHLRFENGPALGVLYDAALEGYSLRRFNSGRFMAELENRQENSPWFWDLAPLATLICEGEFSLTRLKSLPLYPVNLAWPEGDWVSEDTGLGLIGAALLELPPGHHRFFSVSLGLIRDILVDKKGGYLYFDSY